MKFNILALLLLICSCAHNKPDYKSSPIPEKNSRLTIYWPRQWQSQWGKFKVYLNDKPHMVLKNEGVTSIDFQEDEVVVKTHHFQDEDLVILTTLKTKEKREYFLKLDTQPEEVTAFSAMGDVFSVVTLVKGMKSDLRMRETGAASLSDLKNKIDMEKDQQEIKAKSKPLGHHVLVSVPEAEARVELVKCCSSKRVTDF